jgi:hypothetical protein
MLSPTIVFALIFLLGACSVGTLLLAAVHPWLAAR